MATGALNQRAVVQPQINKARTQVIASPVDTMVSPTTGNLSRLAQALSGLGQVAQPLIDLSEKKTQEEYLKAKQEKEMKAKELEALTKRRQATQDFLDGKKAPTDTQDATMVSTFNQLMSVHGQSSIETYINAYMAEHQNEAGLDINKLVDERVQQETKGINDPLIHASLLQKGEMLKADLGAKYAAHQKDMHFKDTQALSTAALGTTFSLYAQGKYGKGPEAVKALQGEIKTITASLIAQGADRTKVDDLVVNSYLAQVQSTGDMGALNDLEQMKNGSGVLYTTNASTREAIDRARASILSAETAARKKAISEHNDALGSDVTALESTFKLSPDSFDEKSLYDIEQKISHMPLGPERDGLVKRVVDVRDKFATYRENEQAVRRDHWGALASHKKDQASSAGIRIQSVFDSSMQVLSDKGAAPEKVAAATGALQTLVQTGIEKHVNPTDMPFWKQLVNAATAGPADTQAATVSGWLISNMVLNKSYSGVESALPEREKYALNAFAAGYAKGGVAAGRAAFAEVMGPGWKAPESKVEKLKAGAVNEYYRSVGAKVSTMELDTINQYKERYEKSGMSSHDAGVAALNLHAHQNMWDPDKGEFIPNFGVGDVAKSRAAYTDAGHFIARESGIFNKDRINELTVDVHVPSPDGTLDVTLSDPKTNETHTVSMTVSDFTAAMLVSIRPNTVTEETSASKARSLAAEVGASTGKPMNLSDYYPAEMQFMSELKDIQAKQSVGRIDSAKAIFALASRYRAAGFDVSASEAVVRRWFPTLSDSGKNLLGNPKVSSSASLFEQTGDTRGAAQRMRSAINGPVAPSRRSPTGALAINPGKGTTQAEASEAAREIVKLGMTPYFSISNVEGFDKTAYADGGYTDPATGKKVSHYSIGFGFSSSQGKDAVIKAARDIGMENPEKFWQDLSTGKASITPAQGAGLFKWRINQDVKEVARLCGGEARYTEFKNTNPHEAMLLVSLQYTLPALAKVMAPGLINGDYAQAREAAERYVTKNKLAAVTLHHRSREFQERNGAIPELQQLNRMLKDIADGLEVGYPAIIASGGQLK